MDISVIIPSYRPENYILKCIDSLRKQTLCSKKFDVLIILNGDKEPFFSNISDYIKALPNFKCVYNPIKGVSAARNLGLNMTNSSKYIVFIDDDDYVSENYLKLLYQAILESNVDIVQSNLKADADGFIYDDYISDAFKKNKNRPFNLVSYRNFFSSVCGKIYRQTIFEEIRFREDITIAEDAIFLFTLSRNVKSFSLTDKNCIYFRNIRLGSALRSRRSTKEVVKNYLKKWGVFSKVYFSKPIKYNFIFFITRILAITKVLGKELMASFKK